MILIKEAIPISSVEIVNSYLLKWNVNIKIVKKRKSKHGDFKIKKDGSHEITINNSQNKYRFLITLIHELSHYIAFNDYGYKIKPHGIEWKRTYKKNMLPLLNPLIFPDKLLSLLANHMKNPKASSDSDFNLTLELKKYDIKSDKVFIFELINGTIFILDNGRKFKKIKKRQKRYECLELKSGKIFLFSPHAEVLVLKE